MTSLRKNRWSPTSGRRQCGNVRRTTVARRSTATFGRWSIVIAALLATARAFALEPSEWKMRQTLTVERAGLLKVVLPATTLDQAQEDLRDLRVVDPSGREVPYAIEGPILGRTGTIRPAATFRATLVDATTQLLIETGSAEPINSIRLTTPGAGFIKAVRIEIAGEDGAWKLIARGVPIFRQFGAEQLDIPLEGHRAQRVRLTLDDVTSRPVPFTAATVVLSATQAPATLPLKPQLLRREEFVGETLLTFDLGASHLMPASLEFVTSEPLFVRNLTLGVRELRGEVPQERIIETGSIYRVAADGIAPRSQLEFSLRAISALPTRELLVHIANGDSPPLTFSEVRLTQYPRWLIFRATEPGSYTLLTGHNQATTPRYDLTALLPSLKDAETSALVISEPTANPGFHSPEISADTPLRGAPLDPVDWRYRKPVIVEKPGVQQIELEFDVLAHAEPSFGDLRLLQEGSQVPYLIERTALARPAKLTFKAANDTKRPSVSRWEIKLPQSGLPLTRLTLASSTAVFQRHLRVMDRVTDARGESFDRTLAEGAWSKVTGSDKAVALPLFTSPQSDTLFLETDNGDNPAIALASIEAAYPVVRLYFKPEPGPLALYYGNNAVTAPRYDLSLVAGRILAAEKSAASLGLEETLKSGARFAPSLRAGVWFWGALGLVVIGLLVVVAKLLPKPK